MDTTQQYINMCEEAREISDKYSTGYDHGDYYFALESVSDGNNIGVVDINLIHPLTEEDLENRFNNLGIEYLKRVKTHITIRRNWWLPRQDQLQQIFIEFMLEREKEKGQITDYNHIYNMYGILEVVKCFALDLVHDGEHIWVDSFEKIWLLFIMYTVYRKQWNQLDKSWQSIQTI